MIDLPQLLDQTAIQDAQWLKTVGSTNTYLLNFDCESIHLPLLVGTESQNQGRGRGSHQWWSGTGSLPFSILLAPAHWEIPPTRWPILSLVTGLAVCRALKMLSHVGTFQVKWPNDVYANGRKICGILIEAHPVHTDQLVIGIGLNVNNSLAEAPTELQHKAIALCDLLGTPLNTTEVLITLVNSLDEQLRELGPDSRRWHQEFRQNCYVSGKMITVRNVSGEVTGTCMGIDEDGALKLLTEQGVERILAGEILIA